MKVGGKGGESKEVTMGRKVEDGLTLSIELFQEIKKVSTLVKQKLRRCVVCWENR